MYRRKRRGQCPGGYTGARDILAERISDNAAFRTYIRNITMNKGVIQSSAKDEKAQSVYEMYYNYEEPVKKAAGHRILALNRGENEKNADCEDSGS